MDVSLSYFLQAISTNPVMLVTVLLTLGVIFVNGWTDAPNAIATCITTRCLGARKAIITSAVFNFLGVLIMTHINSAVASTISNMVDFGSNTHEAQIALCAALFSIVVYSTSESHSLIAGLTGAAIAIHGGLDGVNPDEWIKVIYGLFLSLALGFLSGWVICKLITIICAGMNRHKTNRFFQAGEIFGAAAMSFMHGAQDGQKFIGVLFLGVAFSNGQSSVEGVIIPVWLMIVCSTVMGVGTSVGGEKREDHQVGGHGHGPPGEVPGLFRRPGRRLLPAAVQRVRHSGVHHPHQNQRHHGRGRGEAAVRHQLRRGQGHDAHLGVYLPRLRPHQLCDGQAVYDHPVIPERSGSVWVPI